MKSIRVKCRLCLRKKGKLFMLCNAAGVPVNLCLECNAKSQGSAVKPFKNTVTENGMDSFRLKEKAGANSGLGLVPHVDAFYQLSYLVTILYRRVGHGFGVDYIRELVFEQMKVGRVPIAEIKSYAALCDSVGQFRMFCDERPFNRWLSTIPTSPGLYWVKRNDDESTFLVMVDLHVGLATSPWIAASEDLILQEMIGVYKFKGPIDHPGM
ncbi:MAG TPA: hypothetical protein PKA61_07540 [Nitrospira sp.]|nr:hypothetical protein [Nitrospira sp.]